MNNNETESKKNAKLELTDKELEQIWGGMIIRKGTGFYVVDPTGETRGAKFSSLEEAQAYARSHGVNSLITGM